MDNFIELFNNREKALFIWLIIFLIFTLLQKSIRSAFKNLLKTFFVVKIQVSLLMMLAYVFSLILLLREINLWGFYLLKDTIFWAFGTAFILMVNANKANKEEHYFRKLLLDNLKLILVLEFIVNLYTFNLWIELMFVPVLLLIVVMNAIAETEEKYAPAKKLTDGILMAFGLIVLAYSGLKIYTDFDNFASADNLRAFLLPIILTISFIPFLYLFALFIAYDMFFRRLSIFIPENKKLLRFTKWKIFATCKFDLKKLNSLTKPFFRELTISSDKDDVLKIIDKLQKNNDIHSEQ